MNCTSTISQSGIGLLLMVGCEICTLFGTDLKLAQQNSTTTIVDHLEQLNSYSAGAIL